MNDVMSDQEYCALLHIETATLNVWIEQRWIIPQIKDDMPVYYAADLARGRLILDLIRSMDVNEDGVDIIMELVDQVHGLRGRLQSLMSAIRDQDEDTRQRIAATLEQPRYFRS